MPNSNEYAIVCCSRRPAEAVGSGTDPGYGGAHQLEGTMTPSIETPAPADGEIVHIGRISTPWSSRADCPHTVPLARHHGGEAVIDVDPAYRPGLFGLAAFSHVWLLYWMDEAERDALIQYPRNADGSRGVFSLRSPARPNPIAMAVARVLHLEPQIGRLVVEQLDCRDGTPLIDIKPYRPTIDSVPDARVE